jgi:hypothetical protein
MEAYIEGLRLIGAVCVQYNLPAGDPCWLAMKICGYLEAPSVRARQIYKSLRYEFRCESKTLSRVILLSEETSTWEEETMLREKREDSYKKLEEIGERLYDITVIIKRLER